MSIPGSAAQIPTRAYGLTLASTPFIDRLHALGLRVDFRTIDDPEAARRLFAMGADGVMTDDVRTIAKAGRRAAWLRARRKNERDDAMR